MDYGLTQLKENMRLAVYGNALTAVQDFHRGCSETLRSNKVEGLLNINKDLKRVQLR